MLAKLAKFSRTKTGELILALFSLGMSYLLFSLGVNQGSLGYYILSIAFFVYLLKNVFRLMEGIYHAITK